MDTQ